MSNVLAIVGRPNVGKSTLFNRLVGKRTAIVDEKSGVTRDRHYGKSEWNGKTFSVIDTGGYISGSDDVFEKEIRDQVELAIEEADVILFMVDVSTGLTDLDENVARILRKNGKKVFVVVNKVDNTKLVHEGAEFYGLGLGEIFNVSAINGSGTGELLDEVVKEFKPEVAEEDDLPRLAIIGQPNVGKSSLLNALTGTERAIVTPRAGTTRDPINMHYKSFGFEFKLIDTAGLRKRAKVQEGLEFYSNLRAVRSIEAADVCLLLIDATEGLTAQDLNILFLVEKHHKGLVILVNKWDLVEKNTMSTKEYTKKIQDKIAPFSDVPVVYTSVLNKQRIHKALETALEVYTNRSQRISTSKLNDTLLPIMDRTPPPIARGRMIRIKYVTQLPGRYPQFAFFCNHPKHVKEAYGRFLENQIRKIWNFSGVPMEIYFRKK